MLVLAGFTMVAAAKDRPDNQPFPAYKIIGNVYYVGTNGISSYLITTPAGHILINSGYEETPALIRASVEKLGFHMRDIKILLNGQAHLDHIAGQAELRRMTGAKVFAMEQDAPVIEGGGKGDFRFENEYRYPQCPVDRHLKDGDEVQLDGTTLVAHLTPGHTRGCTTYTFDVEDGDRKYAVVVVGGTSINPGVILVNNPKYPGIADDYARTFRVLRALKCDVFLGAHGSYYGMEEKYQRMKAGAKENPFIDPEGYLRFIDDAQATYRKQLAREKGK